MFIVDDDDTAVGVGQVASARGQRADSEQVSNKVQSSSSLASDMMDAYFGTVDKKRKTETVNTVLDDTKLQQVHVRTHPS